MGPPPARRRKSRKTGTKVSVRKRAPWKPEKGQYIRLWPTRIAVHEPMGALIVGAVLAAIVIIAIHYHLF